MCLCGSHKVKKQTKRFVLFGTQREQKQVRALHEGSTDAGRQTSERHMRHVRRVCFVLVVVHVSKPPRQCVSAVTDPRSCNKLGTGLTEHCIIVRQRLPILLKCSNVSVWKKKMILKWTLSLEAIKYFGLSTSVPPKPAVQHERLSANFLLWFEY